MAFTLTAVTDTHAMSDDEIQRRYVYIDETSNKTLTLLAPLYETDDVDRILSVEPTRQNVERGGQLRVVTTWARPDGRGA